MSSAMSNDPGECGGCSGFGSGGSCSGCGASGAGGATNHPGQSALRWRTSPHGAALARMRDHLAESGRTLTVRALAHQGTDDPAVALLDSWAVVTDIVSFYTERIAQEGFLRTATEAGSVRQHARILGYELRPGISAEAELVIEAETGPGAPELVLVPAGTPVQTVPAPGTLPQTFETSVELQARGAWNELPAVSTVPQLVTPDDHGLWLSGVVPSVKPGDMLLLVSVAEGRIVWDIRTVMASSPAETSDPARSSDPGWTFVSLGEPTTGVLTGEHLGLREELARRGQVVYRLTRRFNVFGWNAPDRTLLRDKDGEPLITENVEARGLDTWGRGDIDLDGDHPAIVAGSWLVLEAADATRAFWVARVAGVAATGASRFGLSGRVTRVSPHPAVPEVKGFRRPRFNRRTALVHGLSEELPAALRPMSGAVEGGDALTIVRSDPLLPAGRPVVVTGLTPDGAPVAEACTVTAVEPAGPDALRLTLDPQLERLYRADTVRVHANVVLATHGETVEQVLGSGDGRAAFQRFGLRRDPLTYRTSPAAATGAVPALEVRVEGVAWTEVPTLYDAGPSDQVYIVRQTEGGRSHVVFGDGVHGSRLPTGTENVRARYRIGLGEDGDAAPGQISLPVRRPRGITAITNPARSRDWTRPEDLERARTNAPQRIRTLDRVVSVADHEDFARGYAAVGRARADLVWDGRVETVVVSVLDARGGGASQALLAGLRSALDRARDPRAPRAVLAAEVVDVRAQLALDVDPRHEADEVDEAVRSALLRAFGGMDLAAPLTAAAVLVVAAGVDGVRSATVPVLSVIGPGVIDPGVLDPSAVGPSAPALTVTGASLLTAQPARFAAPAQELSAPPRLLPAQAVRLRVVVLAP